MDGDVCHVRDGWFYTLAKTSHGCFAWFDRRNSKDDGRCKADAELIAASRTALPSLLDEVERLQAELAKVKVENRKLHTDAMFSQTAGEREACAKVAESYPMFGAVVAAAIRARGESEVSRG
jgi:hypothetical protein